MRTITYDDTRYKLVPVEPDEVTLARGSAAGQFAPLAQSLHEQLASVDENVKQGGLAAFDESCLQTLRKVMSELRAMADASPGGQPGSTDGQEDNTLDAARWRKARDLPRSWWRDAFNRIQSEGATLDALIDAHTARKLP